MNTTERGYGSAHQRRREELLPAAIDAACALCGERMKLGQALDLDHSTPLRVDPTSVGDRIVHASCNRARGLRDEVALIPGKVTGIEWCPICGSPYVGRRERRREVQRTCGRACGMEWKRRNGGWPKAAPPATRDCAECGQPFDVPANTPGQVRCSRSCGRKAAARTRRSGDPVPAYWPLPCARCGGKVERDPRPHGTAPSQCNACRGPNPDAPVVYWPHPCTDCGGPIVRTFKRGRPAHRCDQCRFGHITTGETTTASAARDDVQT